MSEWISVEDKMPEAYGVYIVYVKDENSPYGEGIWYENIVTLAEYAFDEWTWDEHGNEYDITDIVTHWMPLPDPPRMEGENE